MSTPSSPRAPQAQCPGTRARPIPIRNPCRPPRDILPPVAITFIGRFQGLHEEIDGRAQLVVVQFDVEAALRRHVAR